MREAGRERESSMRRKERGRELKRKKADLLSARKVTHEDNYSPRRCSVKRLERQNFLGCRRGL